MLCRIRIAILATDPRAALAAVGALPDAEIDLADAALQLARVDVPEESDWRRAARHLSDIARAAAGFGVARDDLAGQAAALGGLLAGRLGYAGDRRTYEDLANANLIRAIERRRGLPVALGILWLHAAHAAGWDAAGMNLPGHFVIMLRAPSQPAVVLDPFGGGGPVDPSGLPEGVLAPMLRREVLLRLQNNIRLRRAQSGDVRGAIACAEDMLRIAPDAVALWMETASLNGEQGEVEAALRGYLRVIELAPASEAAHQARAAMDKLRSRLH